MLDGSGAHQDAPNYFYPDEVMLSPILGQLVGEKPCVTRTKADDRDISLSASLSQSQASHFSSERCQFCWFLGVNKHGLRDTDIRIYGRGFYAVLFFLYIA